MSHDNYPVNICSSVSRAFRGLSSSSPFYSCVLAMCCALFAISLCTLFAAPKAFAATWPVSASALSASVSFHESYSAGNESYVHSGIDIPASAGMQISSPLAGTVRFTGVVPSGDSRVNGASSQRTMHAVTIEIQNGRTITLMPFDTIGVNVGQAVGEGSYLGTLAASGDASSTSPHVHMGYKVGRRYLDPMQLFGAVSASASECETDSLTAPSLSGRPLSLPETIVSPSEPVLDSTSAVQEEAFSTRPSLETAESFGTIETGDYSFKQNHRSAISPVAIAIERAQSFIAACGGQFDSLMQALVTIAQALSVPLPALLGGAASFLVAVMGAGAAVVLRKVSPRLQQSLQPKKCHESEQFG